MDPLRHFLLRIEYALLSIEPAVVPRADELDDSVKVLDDRTSAPILAALEADGEPAYELLACPGYLWLAAVLLGLVPSDSQGQGANASVASWPFWRGRCAFIWQLSIADASERGCGQCPSLFQASIADLLGEPGATSPLAAGFLEPRVRAELQQATAPLLRSYKRGAPVGSPQVILPEEEAADGSDALEAMLQGFDDAAAGSLKDAPESIKACLLVEVANRLCWYNRLKVWQQTSDAACKMVDFNYELTGVLGIKREHQTTEYAQLVVKARGKENIKGVEVEEVAKTPGTLSLKAVDDMTDVLETPKLSQTLSETLGALELMERA
eukprot:Skav214113  [mRNA]  locus=scaffold1185:358918:363703:- [translate_table: standard]